MIEGVSEDVRLWLSGEGGGWRGEVGRWWRVIECGDE